MTTTKEKFDESIRKFREDTRRIKPKGSDKQDSPKSTSKPKPKPKGPKGPTGPTWMAKGPTVDIGYLPKKRKKSLWGKLTSKGDKYDLGEVPKYGDLVKNYANGGGARPAENENR